MKWEGGLPTFGWFGDDVAGDHLEAGTSYHETGHWLLGRLHGIPMELMKVELHRENEASYGEVNFRLPKPERGERHAIPPEILPGWLASVAAGQVAHAMWYERYKEVTFEEGLGLTEVGAWWDQGLFTQFGGKNPPLTLPQAREYARAKLTEYWPLVEQNAGTLYARKTMHADQMTDPRRARRNGFL
jgi:hypothetical protein